MDMEKSKRSKLNCQKRKCNDFTDLDVFIKKTEAHDLSAASTSASKTWMSDIAYTGGMDVLLMIITATQLGVHSGFK